MNTTLNNADKIQKAFSAKFDEGQNSKEHLAQMLAFSFLSEVEKIMDERHILKKDLAKSINVSPSYITQLYRGSKPLNFETLAKIESVLDIRFEVKAVTKDRLELYHHNEYYRDTRITKSMNDNFITPANSSH